MAGAGFRHVSVGRRDPWVAAEKGGAYEAGAAAEAPPLSRWSAAAPPAVEALEGLTAAIERLAQVDWDAEDAETLTSVAVALQTQANKLAGQQLGSLAAVDRVNAHAVDGSATLASWWRNRTSMDYPAATAMAHWAVRLGWLPRLRAALEAGDVTLAHVTAVTGAATGQRLETIAAADATLTDLAKSSTPSAVRQAMRFLADLVDPDGSDAKPLPDGPDGRRHHDQWDTVDGLLAYQGLADPAVGELLRSLLDAHDTPDAPDTPPEPDTPTVHGIKGHFLGMIDLARWMGRPERATFQDQLQRAGRVDPWVIARLIEDAAITIVLTYGPWRVVNVGRTHRTLPAWLRPMPHMLHRRCRGPDCDRPAAWTEAHHEKPWAQGGHTDLNKTMPLCKFHHDLVTTGGWTVTPDLDHGNCIWTSPTGRVHTTNPH